MSHFAARYWSNKTDELRQLLEKHSEGRLLTPSKPTVQLTQETLVAVEEKLKEFCATSARCLSTVEQQMRSAASRIKQRVLPVPVIDTYAARIIRWTPRIAFTSASPPLTERIMSLATPNGPPALRPVSGRKRAAKRREVIATR